MASHTGILSPVPEYLEFANRSVNISDYVAEFGGIWESEKPSVGTFNQAPSMQVGQQSQGVLVDSFLTDYYNHIFIYPATIDFGYILSEASETFVIWNAYFVSKTCSDIIQTGMEDVTLDGLVAPFTLKSLQHIEYTVTATPIGDSILIYAFIHFYFETDIVQEHITGERVVLFAWKPLLEPAMQESLEWLTNIITTRNGYEQRIALRKNARQSYRFSTFFKTERQQAMFDAILFDRQKLVWGLPIWPEKVMHNGTINAGTLTIVADFMNADFRDSSFAVLWKSETDFETVKVLTVTDSLMTLGSATTKSFSGEFLIMPVRLAQISSKITKKNSPDRDSLVQTLNFAVVDNAQITGYSATATYNGAPVLNRPSYADDDQDTITDSDILVTDYSTGKFTLLSDSEFNISTTSYQFKNFTKAACWTFKQFLHYLLGRQNTVWIPTYKDDLFLVSFLYDGDTSLRVENAGFTKYMGLNAMRTHLAFTFPNGIQLYRRITGISIDGDEELIGIDTALGLDLYPGDCMISFMELHRASSDIIEINWNVAGQNDARFNFQRVVE